MDTLTENITAEAQGVDLAVLVFLVFIYVSDSEKDITPQEVQRFQTLMNDLHWTDNEDMCRALTTLRFNYTATWADYEAGTLAADRDAIARQLARFEQEFGDRAGECAEGGSCRPRRSASAGGRPGAGVRFALGESKGRATARQELEALLAHPMPAAARPCRARPISTRKPAPISTAGAEPWTAEPGWRSARLPVWQGGRIKVRCIAAIDETRDTRTFTLRRRPAPPVQLQARPVRHAGAAGRRPDPAPQLHDLVLAVAALHPVDHGQARAQGLDLELAARHHGAGIRARADRPAWPFHLRRPARRQAAVPRRRQRHHAGDVDAALARRHRLCRRHRADQQCPDARRRDLRAGAAASQLAPGRMPCVSPSCRRGCPRASPGTARPAISARRCCGSWHRISWSARSSSAAPPATWR